MDLVQFVVIPHPISPSKNPKQTDEFHLKSPLFLGS